MGTSGNYGSENEKKELRRELGLVLASMYDSIMLSGGAQAYVDGKRYEDSESCERIGCIVDALAGLVKREELSHVVETLEMSGVLNSKQARHFLGISSRKQLTLEEAALPPLPGPAFALQSKVVEFCRRTLGLAVQLAGPLG